MNLKRSVCGSCLFFALVSLAACGEASAPARATATSTTSDQGTAQLEAKMDELASELRTLRSEFEDSRGRYSEAIFDPAEESFQRIDAPTGFGSFAVSIKDVQPFGDGVRLRINFGNPSSANFSNLTVKVQYGTRSPEIPSGADADASSKWIQDFSAWKKSLQQKEITLTDVVKSGSWNPIAVTLPGVRADRFGYVKMSINTSQISLATR